MKTLIDKTFNNAKIKEINANIHKYLSSKNLDICFTNENRYLRYRIVEKGQLFTPQNIKLELRTGLSFTVDNAYNHLLNLLESLMMEFGWSEDLSSGKGWNINNPEHTRQIMLDTIKPYKGKHIEEIKRVKELGEEIGYGNIMEICSILWALKVESQGHRTIPRVVVTPRASEDDCQTEEELIRKRMEDYKSFGF